MASGPKFNAQRGTWWVQWFDGQTWHRETVTRKLPGWKTGDTPPRKAPPEAHAAFVRLAEKERRARQRHGYGTEVTISDFLEGYSEAYLGREPGSKLELQKAVRVFLAWVQTRGLTKLEQVTATVCTEWIEARALTIAAKSGKPITHATLKKERGLLSGAWSSAVERGHLEVNPWRMVKVPVKPEMKKRGSWSPQEFEKLLAVTSPWLRLILIIGTNTGLRIEALLGLQWTDVKFDRGRYGEIEVRPELDKAHKGYTVPLTHLCHDTLMARFLHRGAHVTHVIVGQRGKPILRSNVTHRAIVAACKRAKLKTPDSPNHHMRRTYGRWAVMGHLTGKPIPVYVVSQWFGHASIDMTEKYLQLSREDSAKWIEQAPDRIVLANQVISPQAALGQDPEST